MYLFTISPICIFLKVHRAWLHCIATNLWTTSKLHFPLKNRNQASGRTMWFKEFYNFLKAIIWNWHWQHRFPKHMFIIVFRFILPPSNILFIFICGTDWLNISLHMRNPFDWSNIYIYIELTKYRYIFNNSLLWSPFDWLNISHQFPQTLLRMLSSVDFP